MFGTTAMHQSHHQHHHYPNHTRGPAIAPTALSPESAKAGDLFESFITASTLKSVLLHYRLICDVLKLRATNFRQFYPKLKSKIRSWRAQALWNKYDKRASHKCYNQGKAGVNSKVLIIGAGPCGLRAAVEAQLLGAKVVVVEKRDRFSRNNVLHLWPFVIADLKALGAKKFYGKFCAGAIDHISIRQLQCILLKVALLLGVEIIEGVAFEELLQPPEDQSQRTGWHAKFSPLHHPVNHYEFDVLIGADGKRNTLLGFKRKEFRGKLAIAITANFINRHSELEACVQEISGVAFIFNQKFFKDLYAETGIDLENIVYYKDETHYFVMTAKKHSLIDKGVIMKDCSDTVQLLHPNNVDRQSLCAYASEAAGFSTNYLLPHRDFAVNHYGKPDIAMFDFTSMFAAVNACRVIDKHGHKLLMLLVGDSLLEPFWPTGSGCARGFLSCFDACWTIRSWASDSMTHLEVIAERESTYRLLGQTTPENLAKDIMSYTLEPSSRYPTINLKSVLPFQVRHLRTTDQLEIDLEEETQPLEVPRKRKRRDSIMHPDTLLAWCQKQVENHDIPLNDLDASFKNGMALCAIIHRYRPFYIEFPCLEECNCAENNQLAFDILEKEFAISPVMTGNEMAACIIPDRLTMISYLSQVCDVFRGQIPQFMSDKKTDDDSQNLDDFPMQHEVELSKSNLSKTETSRSEGNLFKCKILNTKENISKDDLFRSKKRRSEVGSLDKLDRELKRPTPEQTENFNDRVKYLEDKFKIGDGKNKKPKDLVRAIGKLEKSDWNMSAIVKKISENTIPIISNKTERVPKWNRDSYNDKQLSIEKRLRDNGEDENRIAKYLDIDASLKRMERKLKEGSTLDVGLRGHNKVSNLANQLASKLVRKEENKTVFKQPKAVVLPTSVSDLCYFCSLRVYLVERMSAEGKFFHRKCFKCSYCHALLRLGNYIYDREGRYGGHFFCIPHFGMLPKTEQKQRTMPLITYHNKGRINGDPNNGGNTALILDTSLADGRGTTPERAEFENSLVEQSDEDEYLSEDEWTDRNFGMSANELDETDDSDCSDFDDQDEDQLVYEMDYQISAEETKRLAEKWKRRYSSNREITDKISDSDDLSEERGADGDESHTATEGEYEDDNEDDGEAIKRARALRRQELNINVDAPIIHTSESGSDTEVATESEESDTHIDTDSEFTEDIRPSLDVPKIMINDSNNTAVESSGNEVEFSGDEKATDEQEDTIIVPPDEPNPHTEHLQRLLRRTESTEAITARRNLLLRTNYLLGENNHAPKRSVSSTDVGDRFKNFMDKISATQTKLKPAPQPSASMRAFLNASKGNSFVSVPVVFQTPEITEPRFSITSLCSSYPSHRTYDTPATSKDSIISKESSVFVKESSSILDEHNNVCKKSSELSKDSSYLSKDLAGLSHESSSLSKELSGLSNKCSSLLEESPQLSEECCSLLKELSDEGVLESNSSIAKYEPTSTKKDVPSFVSSHCDNYSASDLFGKEVKLNTSLTNSKNAPVRRKMFDFRLGDEVVEAINEEIMTSNAKSSDDETGLLVENETSKEHEATIMGAPEVQKPVDRMSLFNSSFVNTESYKPTLDRQLERRSKDSDNILKSKFSVAPGYITSVAEFPHLNVMDEKTIENKIDSGVSIKSTLRTHTDLKFNTADTAINKFSLHTNKKEQYEPINKGTTFERMNESQFSPIETIAKTTTIPVGFEYSDENDIDSVFDQLAGEAMHDLDHHKLTIDGFEPAGESTEINFVSEDIFVKDKLDDKFVTDIVIDDNPRADLDEFNDMEDEFGWAEESTLDSAGEEFNLSEMQSIPKSIKSLEHDVPTQPSNLVETQDIEYMDTSSESSSSDSSETFSYNPLENVQSPDVSKPREDLNFPIITSLSHSSISPNLNRPVEKSRSFDSKKIFGEVQRTPETTSDNSSLLDSYKSSRGPSPGRYEGYIPRFKDRVTPFRYVRDSIDVRKNASSKPLCTAVREVALVCVKNPTAPLNTITAEPTVSPPVCNNQKPKDGDLVRDMVMSRITKPDKTRRGSRGSLLLTSGSRSSLFGDNFPDSTGSLENLSSSNVNVSSVTDDSNVNISNDVDNLVEPNRNFYYEAFSNMPKNILPVTPLTHPGNFIQEKSSSTARYQSQATAVPVCDTFEYNTLEEDSHLINRKKSMASSRPRPLETFEPRLRPLETTRACALESLTTRHLDSTLVRPTDSASRQLEIFASQSIPDSNSEQLDTFTARPVELIYERPRRASESEVESVHSDVAVVDPASKTVSQWNVDDKSVNISDKEVRLKRLLTEHRKKEFESTKSKNVDSCVRDCLEEYRQKRYSAPSPHLTGNERIPDIYQRHSKRPSVLELESLQVFTTSGAESVPATVSSQENSQPELRKQKKSKDRERRRSLIQVVAGMFNKSDDKKKSEDKMTKDISTSLDPSSSESYSSPKSPSVRERFSNLVLSKPKEKTSDKSDRGESSRRETSHGAQPPPSAIPSPRNLFSFLTKSGEKKMQPAEENDDDLRNGLADGQQTPSARRHKAALRAAKQAEHKRLRIAQEIQRQLEECEIKTRELEDKGISVEKALRGETENMKEETDLMRDWFSLVHEKNALSRWEQELTVKARELQLEDRHMRLENELRQKMAFAESDKKRDDIDGEGIILAEMLGILEQKDSLVSLLEEDRKRYLEEDKDLKKVMEKKGLRLSQRRTGV